MRKKGITSVEDVMTDPNLLKNMGLEEVKRLLGVTQKESLAEPGQANNWRGESLRKGSYNKGQGFVLREGNYIQYDPETLQLVLLPNKKRRESHTK